MGPIFKFLNSLRSLAKTKNMTIKDAYKFAEQEFGEVSNLLKLQINKILKTLKHQVLKNHLNQKVKLSKQCLNLV